MNSGKDRRKKDEDVSFEDGLLCLAGGVAVGAAAGYGVYKLAEYYSINKEGEKEKQLSGRRPETTTGYGESSSSWLDLLQTAANSISAPPTHGNEVNLLIFQNAH